MEVEKTFEPNIRVMIEVDDVHNLYWMWDRETDSYLWDDDDHLSGDIIVEGKTCINYVGDDEPPKEVIQFLQELGYSTSKIEH